MGPRLAECLLECQHILESPEGGLSLRQILPSPDLTAGKGVQLWQLALLPTLHGG